MTIIGEVEWSEPDYSFDFSVVWQDDRGQYWIGSDSGCSCPSPFEDYTDINELDGPLLKEQVAPRLESLIDEHSYYSYPKAQLMREISEVVSRL